MSQEMGTSNAMASTSGDATDNSALSTQHSAPNAFRAWCVLVVQSFQRHWRVRQMGWVSLGLLAIVVFWVALITARDGWNLAEQRARRSYGSYRFEAERLRPGNRYAAAAGGAHA